MSVLDIAREKGFLLEKEVFELVSSLGNEKLVSEFLETVGNSSSSKMITLSSLNKNFQSVQNFVGRLNGEEKNFVEKIFVNFGLSLEVRREVSVVEKKEEVKKDENGLNYKVFYADTRPEKKLEVKDFTGYFRTRFQHLQKILMQRPELQKDLTSIGKISSDRSALSVIGIVSDKRITKNKNLILSVEDLTGEIKVLVKVDREEVFEKAYEVQLDDVIGIKGAGNKDFLFAQDIFHPDSFLLEKTKFNEDASVAFVSDLHCGSNRHLGKSFENFLAWLNSEDENAGKIKYLFFVGDNVDGVGIFPGQEDVLNLKSMKEQYEFFVSYLKKIPKNITVFICPGQHDASRVAEPQPIIDKRYAPGLYELENVVLVTNPAMIKLLEGEKEFKVLMYHGASIHNFINEIKELREMKAHKCPAKAVKHMLKRRHLAPTHSAVTYIPNHDSDPLLISEIPDVLCTGEVHRMDIENYNGTLIITGGCWQAQTPFEEKVGNIPDPGKVPVLNLKTRQLKIFDFGIEDEINKDYN